MSVWVYFQVQRRFHYRSCFPSQRGSTLTGKNLLLLKQILPFKSRPYFGRVSSSREANRKSKVVSLLKMAETRIFFTQVRQENNSLRHYIYFVNCL